MKTIKIAGVPEHFNLPWHLSLDNNEFKDVGIELQWIDVSEGTGKMCQMLREGTTDIAIILTEGIVKDIVAGNPSKIVQVYVESPLIWGIHVDAKSNFKSIADIENKKAAISRLGSGSHLMAIVNAQNQGWAVDSLKFEIVNTIDGAVKSLTSQKSDYFMWEQFMTKPLVDQGVFRRIAECPTPWPCFVIAVRDEILKKYPNTVSQILEIINLKTQSFKQISNIETIIAEKYHLNSKDVNLWLTLTQWSQSHLSEEMLNKIQNQLVTLKIIDKKVTFTELIKVL